MSNLNALVSLHRLNNTKLLLNKFYSGHLCFYTNYESGRFVISRNCQTHSLTSNNYRLSATGNIVKKKIDDLVAKYEQITGMDEVRIAQNRVIEAQDKFIVAQEKRRDIVKELTVIQNKLKEVYAELDTTTRGEER